MSDKQRTCLTGVIAKLYRNRGPKTSSGLLTELKEKNRTNGKRDTRHLEKRELLVEIQPAYESEYDDVRDNKDGRRDGDILRLEALDEEHKTDEVDTEPTDIERQLRLLDPEFKNDITEREHYAAEKEPDKSSHNSVTVIVASNPLSLARFWERYIVELGYGFGIGEYDVQNPDDRGSSRGVCRFVVCSAPRASGGRVLQH